VNLDVSETVRKDRHTGVNWVADLAADVFKSDVDCAAQLREAFAAGNCRKEMVAAKLVRYRIESDLMKSIFIGISFLAMCLPIAEAAGQGNVGTPQQQYSSLLKEYNSVASGIRRAKTDLERKMTVERMAGFAAKFVKLAETDPKDPIALTALKQAVQAVGSTDSAAQITWETNQANYPRGNTDGSVGRTVDLVLRDHVLSDKLGPVIDRMRYGYRLEYEKCLLTVLEKNPHHEIQGLTCMVLAQFLNDKLKMIRLARDRPELAECYKIVFGKDYLPRLQKLGEDKLAARIEALFERAANEYADVKFRSGSVGETAKAGLYETRYLNVGRVAPDIEGRDQNGTQFKLSDYRGKVVLLYFWSEY